MKENKALKKISPLLNLKEAFAQREKFYSNRSSCIFPIYLKSKNNDLYIVFLNYYSIKNKILNNKLILNLRIYNNDGILIKLINRPFMDNHNQISIRELINDDKRLNFEGMIEVEIISTENLKFPFPGIIGIYRSKDYFSCVHAAGRIKNSDENQLTYYTKESNWSCKFTSESTPFFHLFIGNKPPLLSTITVFLNSHIGEVIKTIVIDISKMNPFSSKIFLIDELFKDTIFKSNYFISVLVEHGSIFPRMVVGNYFKKIHHLEVTHSFSTSDNEDYCQFNDLNEITSMLNLYTDENLSLSFRVFPTNCEGNFSAKFQSQSFSSSSLSSKGIEKNYSTNIGTDGINDNLDSDERFLVAHLIGDKIPSRFNTSFIYKVKNSNSLFSTDIASGAKSNVYPPKYRHWGHGFTELGFSTVILIRNNSHTPSLTKDGKGILTVFNSFEKYSLKFLIKSESAISIPLLENKVYKNPNKDPNFLSWFIELDIPNCETFWISYRKKDGAIFGEHGF